MTHRSRTGWADPMDQEPPTATAPTHSHRLPGSVRLAMAGLVAAVLLLAVAVGFLTVYVYQANQYVQGRGEFRDAETARLEEQIRRSICDLLDQLPEGGLLDRPRAKYDCGPGLPAELLTPQEQARLADRRPPPVTDGEPQAPAPAAPTAPDVGPGLRAAVPPPPSPDVDVPPPSPPAPPDAPPPAAEPAPLGDLVCALLPFCPP